MSGAELVNSLVSFFEATAISSNNQANKIGIVKALHRKIRLAQS